MLFFQNVLPLNISHWVLCTWSQVLSLCWNKTPQL